MDKLERIRKFVDEESLKVMGNLHSEDKVDYGINVGVLYVLEKIKHILESDDGVDNK